MYIHDTIMHTYLPDCQLGRIHVWGTSKHSAEHEYGWWEHFLACLLQVLNLGGVISFVEEFPDLVNTS